MRLIKALHSYYFATIPAFDRNGAAARFVMPPSKRVHSIHSSFYPSILLRGSKSAQEVDMTSMETERLPLETLFEGRNYIFSTVRNIRGYEWGETERDELWEDLIDEAFHDNPREYELQMIVLVYASWDKAALGTGCRYDVHDGQQRLVTLCLLFAALRDSLGPEDEEQLNEICKMLNPKRARKDEVLRIQLRPKDNRVLEQILTPTTPLVLPSARERKILSSTELLIIKNYEEFLERVTPLTPVQKEHLISYLREDVYMIVSKTQNAVMARNLVRGQGKGKNNEAIDDFKGLVCYGSIREVTTQDEIFRQWDCLATNSDGVGRDIIIEACLVMAQAYCKKRLRKNCELELLSEWLTNTLIEEKHWDGATFFDKRIGPASRTLGAFRNGAFDLSSVKGSGLERSIRMRLQFLRVSTLPKNKASELLIALLPMPELQLDAVAYDKWLAELELVALWMMLSSKKPKPLERCNRSLMVLEMYDTNRKELGINSVVSQDECKDILISLDSLDFGKSAPLRRAAMAILERLNAHILCQKAQAFTVCEPLQIEHILPQKVVDEYWNERWNEELRERWTHRLGNLALLNQKANAKATNAAFDLKQAHYRGSPYPLTSQLDSEYVEWDETSVKKRHENILSLAKEVWPQLDVGSG